MIDILFIHIQSFFVYSLRDKYFLLFLFSLEALCLSEYSANEPLQGGYERLKLVEKEFLILKMNN